MEPLGIIIPVLGGMGIIMMVASALVGESAASAYEQAETPQEQRKAIGRLIVTLQRILCGGFLMTFAAGLLIAVAL